MCGHYWKCGYYSRQGLIWWNNVCYLDFTEKTKIFRCPSGSTFYTKSKDLTSKTRSTCHQNCLYISIVGIGGHTRQIDGYRSLTGRFHAVSSIHIFTEWFCHLCEFFEYDGITFGQGSFPARCKNMFGSCGIDLKRNNFARKCRWCNLSTFQ